ncbi:MAG: hypothetical protein ACPG21_04195 [Crocinitomicaceae bacterium]
MVEGNYELSGNDTYVEVGVCWSKSQDPLIEDNFLEVQTKATSTLEKFLIEGLDPSTVFYIRSYVRTNGHGIIYSENWSFETEAPAEPPCETDEGIVNVDGVSYTADPLNAFDGTYYQLKSYTSYGELNFEFSQRPSIGKNYKTVISNSDLNENNIKVSGILGTGFWTCYYGAPSNQEVFVRVNEANEISIQLCDLKLSTNGYCSPYVLITGKASE